MDSQFVFPKGNRFFNSVDNAGAPDVLVDAGARTKVNHLVIANPTAGAITYTFQKVGAAGVVIQVSVPAGDTLVLPGWEVDTGGLEVLSNSASASFCAIFYVEVGHANI